MKTDKQIVNESKHVENEIMNQKQVKMLGIESKTCKKKIGKESKHVKRVRQCIKTG